MGRRGTSTLVLGLAAACAAGSKPKPVASASRTNSTLGSALNVADRCAMVEAAFRLDALREFACGNVATKDQRMLVDVDMVPRFTPDETCSSAVFAIYREGEPTNTDAVLRLTIRSRDAQTWEFGASYFDPPSSPDDQLVEGGFEDANYYCGFIDGRLARSAGGWRAWVEHAQ